MELANYVTLTRQVGLDKEMQTVANNIANISTTGYKRQGVVFAEMVKTLPTEGGSVAFTDARGRFADKTQGVLVQTKGTYDLAVEGEGFFTIQTPAGERLTRAGAFTRDPSGQLVTLEGNPVLDEGGGQILISFEARTVAVASDGTVSADGKPVARVGLVVPEDWTNVFREGGTLFRVDGDVRPVEPAEGRVIQGFVEQSNVNPVTEMTRMIFVQRAYELAVKMMDQEDQRIKQAVRVLSGTS